MTATSSIRTVRSLDTGWELAHTADSNIEPGALDADGWKPAIVPGTVQQALTELGVIENPLFENNALKAEWIERQTWWYRCLFDLDTQPEGISRLVFDGLDTLATVWLNGRELGHHRNQFTPFRLDVSDQLQEGRNEIFVRFEPVHSAFDEAVANGLWQEYDHLEAVFVRKSQTSFGWDLSPRIVTVGVWRPARIETYCAVIEDVHVLTTGHGDRARAKIAVRTNDSRANAHVRISITSRSRGAVVATETARIGACESVADISVDIDNPELWWPRGYGTQPLYDCVTELLIDEVVIDRHSTTFGIRSVQLAQNGQSGATSFTFHVNGIGVFCKGSNWVPDNSMTLRGTPERYRKQLALAAAAGVNMLRVWGGGIYEESVFYDLCDELGILVWQDFMYSCAVYPHGEPEFAAAATREAEIVVTQLRNHPSIVMWCGNNECQWSHDSHRAADPTLSHRMPGLDFFESTLATVCRDFDGTRPYVPTSPIGGANPNSPQLGDRHAYRVGFGELDDEDFNSDHRWSIVGPQGYRNESPRFVSEFAAVPGLPEPEAFPRFLGVDSRHSRASAWRSHIPTWPGDIDFQANLEFYTACLFGVPSDAVVTSDEFQRYARLVQGTYIETGIREFRSQWPHCAGALFWQFNSMWPSFDWGVLDDAGVPKPSYYFAKRALSDALVNLGEKNGQLEATVIVGGREAHEFDWYLISSAADGSGETRQQGTVKSDPAAVVTIEFDRYAIDEVSTLTLRRAGQTVAREVYLALDTRVSVLAPSRLGAAVIRKAPSFASIRVTTDNFAHFVRIAAYGSVFTDNYFHLEPGGTREILVELPEHGIEQLEVSALNSTGPITIPLPAWSA